MLTSIVFFVLFLGWYLYAHFCKKSIVYWRVHLISIFFSIYLGARLIVDIIFYTQVLKDPKADENDDAWEKVMTIFSTIVSRLKYAPLYWYVALAEDHRID
jgi:hypothetical protein